MAGKVVKQLAGSGSGQSLADRVNAAKYSLAGSGLGKGVVKATTEEIVPPKKKHLDYLTNCTNEVNVSIPELAEYLIDRLQQTSAVVVMKTLITTHHLLNFGNEKFSQYMAAKDSSLHLPGFVDKSSPSGYEMSQYIKLYSKYVNEKTATYRLMAFDLCKIKRGRDDGVLRRMPLEKLMKTLPILQGQINVLIEFDASAKELSNPVLLAAFTLMYKDLIRLFASYNEGLINLIEQYFTMSRKMCQEALTMYKAFLELTEKVLKFVTVAENAGVGDKASLGLQAVPPKVLQTLENHLANLEKRKTSQSDSDDGKVAATAPSMLPLPSKTKKRTKVTKKHDDNRTKTEDHKTKEDEHKVKHDEVKVKPERGKCPVQKPQESNSHDLLNDIFNNTPDSDTSNTTPVRTQLRRPEQQHSVAVTVQRAGRSPSPNRPSRPPQSRSRDPSPAKVEQNIIPAEDEPDLFINLRDDSSALTVSPTTPGNGQPSPFGGDEKAFGDYGSFWSSIVENNDSKNNAVDFEAAFKKENEDDDEEESLPEQSNETNLLEIDLLGLDVEEQPAVNQAVVSHNMSHGLADLDELLDLGCSSMGDTPLIPSALTSNVSKSTSDNMFDSISYVNPNTNINVSVQPKAPVNAVKKTTTPAKNADTNLSDTLAFLADSLGKGENKWSSNAKQKQTLSGNTIDVIGLSSGPTIDWSKSTTSSSTVTKAEPTANNNNHDLLDLLG